MNQIVVTEEYPFGCEGLDSSEVGPMYRALRGLLQHGKPGDRNIGLYFLQPNAAWPRWLGVLTFTKGRRLLFFPSTHQPYRILENTLAAPRAHIVDHLTLEPDFKHSHITSPNSNHHTPSGATKPVGEAHHWFTMHYQSCVFMHPHFRNVEYRFDVPEKDTDRRLAEFEKSREGISHHIISLHTDSTHGNHNHVGFSFYAGKPGFTNVDQIPRPPDCPFEIEERYRIHRVNIDKHTELQISAYCVSEYLKREAQFYF